jgi:hypothetical protein
MELRRMKNELSFFGSSDGKYGSSLKGAIKVFSDGSYDGWSTFLFNSSCYLQQEGARN